MFSDRKSLHLPVTAFPRPGFSEVHGMCASKTKELKEVVTIGYKDNNINYDNANGVILFLHAFKRSPSVLGRTKLDIIIGMSRLWRLLNSFFSNSLFYFTLYSEEDPHQYHITINSHNSRSTSPFRPIVQLYESIRKCRNFCCGVRYPFVHRCDRDEFETLYPAGNPKIWFG